MWVQNTFKTHLNSEFHAVVITSWAWLAWPTLYPQHWIPACRGRQMTDLLISGCCRAAHFHQQHRGVLRLCAPPFLVTSPPPPPATTNSQTQRKAVGKSRDIWQEVDRWRINFIASLKLISDSINLLSMVKNPFQILGSSEQQDGMSSVS